ncbi:growth factor receptor-bound protein 14-like isoform X3 [Tachypleus tridentatus]|uniref:growth factor receptor-bound protein 14-like isoform X3 n=1 Tax=Tachypleus tridentatus TaxID=6853 RepID=UPI003FD6BEE3
MNCLHLNHAFLGTPIASTKFKKGKYGMLMDSGINSDYHCPLIPITDNKTDHSCLKEVALNFYLEDGRHHRMVVEEGLRASDLCSLLILKFNLVRSYTWTIVEQFRDLEIERALEDHEEVLQMYIDSWNLCSCDRRFIVRQDFHKYQFFQNPERFYPLELVDLESQLDCPANSTVVTKIIVIQNMLHLGNSMPVVQSFLWFKDSTLNSWRKYFFRIEENILRFSIIPEKKDPKQMHSLLDLRNCDIFMPTGGKSKGSPTNFSFCIKSRSLERSTTDLKWFCCVNEKGRKCWIVALRLAKFGTKLRENYSETKSRRNSVDNSPLYLNIGEHRAITFDSLSCKKLQVAMDFTGQSSHVVQNSIELKAVAAVETMNRKQEASIVEAVQPSVQPTLEFGVSKLQPWFYSGMTREEATQLLTKYRTVNGVFLVRESNQNPGRFVLSYVFNKKTHHTEIYPIEEKNQLCYTLDGGKTKFYDLLQLVEFYQLNLGCLPTKLKHFFVHKPKRTQYPV